MKRKNKFSASEWKDAIDSDVLELKKAVADIYKFIGIFEQWRRISFNETQKGETSETNAKKENRGTNTSSPSKGKSGSKNVHRKARAKSN